jgi:L-fuculose-phosphate aldolase
MGTRGKALLLKHHGVVVVGRSIRDAIVSAIELDRTCGCQLLAMAASRELHLMPQAEIDDCKKFLASDAFVEGTWAYYVRKLQKSGQAFDGEGTLGVAEAAE